MILDHAGLIPALARLAHGRKTGRAPWVNVSPVLFAAVLELCPR
jgi:hypothetical protein